MRDANSWMIGFMMGAALGALLAIIVLLDIVGTA